MALTPELQHVLVAARDGDEPALHQVLRLCLPDIRRYAYRHCPINDVDDAVQETLLVVSRHLRSVRVLAAFSGWLFKVVRHECHRLSRTALKWDPWDDGQAEAWASQPDTALRIDLARALLSLPEHYREIILLRDAEELSIGEIAQRLGLGTAAVKSRLHRARALTREYLVA